jgi:hypothetical protein
MDKFLTIITMAIIPASSYNTKKDGLKTIQSHSMQYWYCHWRRL